MCFGILLFFAIKCIYSGLLLNFRYLQYGEAFCNDLTGWSQSYYILLDAFKVVGFDAQVSLKGNSGLSNFFFKIVINLR